MDMLNKMLAITTALKNMDGTFEVRQIMTSCRRCGTTDQHASYQCPVTEVFQEANNVWTKAPLSTIPFKAAQPCHKMICIGECKRGHHQFEIHELNGVMERKLQGNKADNFESNARGTPKSPEERKVKPQRAMITIGVGEHYFLPENAVMNSMDFADRTRGTGTPVASLEYLLEVDLGTAKSPAGIRQYATRTAAFSGGAAGASASQYYPPEGEAVCYGALQRL
jgi:hypothetical protein